MTSAPILYFFKGDTLSDIPEPFSSRMVTKSSGRYENMTGTFASPFKNVLTTGISTADYTWTQVDEILWIGIHQDFHPDLVRRTSNHSGFMKLIGENEWIIPILNPYSENCSLPRCETIKWDPDKEERVLVSEITDEYSELTSEVADLVFELQDKMIAQLQEKQSLENVNVGNDLDDNRLRKLVSKSSELRYYRRRIAGSEDLSNRFLLPYIQCSS